MEVLLKEIRKAHAELITISVQLENLRYHAMPGAKRPKQSEYERVVERAYWRASNAAERFLPMVSALRLLVKGEK